jgi:hypothetical protein
VLRDFIESPVGDLACFVRRLLDIIKDERRSLDYGLGWGGCLVLGGVVRGQ